MVYWEWNSNMEVGIELIDSLQRDLVDSTNQLFAAVAEHRPVAERFGTLLMKLEQVVSLAFSAEEDVYRRCGFARSASHRAAHADFSRQSLSLLLRHHTGENIALETLQLLADWLAYHQVHGLGASKGLLEPGRAA